MSEHSEARLRAALRAEADEVDVDPTAWSKVQARAASRRSRGRWPAVAAAVVAAGVTVGVGALVLDGNGDTTVDVVPAGSTSTTAGDTTPPDTTPTTAPASEVVDAIWPFTSLDEVDAYLASPGVGMFLDAEATALEFAREYLHMPDPTAPDGFQRAEDRSGRVEVHPRPGSPLTTTVWVQRFGGDEGAWSVYLVETENIAVDRDGDDPIGRHVGGSLTVSGTSTAFEAHVDVEVRDAGGRELGRTYVMGGANGELAPFTGEIAIAPSSTPTGAVVFSTSSAEDGTVQEATVVRITFATTTEATGTEFSLFFHRDEELVEVRRTGTATTGVLRQALDALVAGPQPDDGAGLSSLFSSETSDVLAGVNLRDGTAVVDFAETVDNASTSAGSEAFLESLDATIFQFPTVERIEYRLRGSCDDFWTWLQRDGCQVVDSDR